VNEVRRRRGSSSFWGPFIGFKVIGVSFLFFLIPSFFFTIGTDKVWNESRGLLKLSGSHAPLPPFSSFGSMHR